MGNAPLGIFLSYTGWALGITLVFGLGNGGLGAEQADGGGRSASAPSAHSQGGKEMTLQVTSPAFTQGHPIPKKYTGEGADVSPPLAWSGAPEATKQLVLICDDPDAPTDEPWVHWVMYQIPPNVRGLPEGIPRKTRLKEPHDALQGKNSWPETENIGYRGPMPPKGHGVHHYYFKLYALDAALPWEPGADKRAVMEAIHGHILADGALIGTYER